MRRKSQRSIIHSSTLQQLHMQSWTTLMSKEVLWHSVSSQNNQIFKTFFESFDQNLEEENKAFLNFQELASTQRIYHKRVSLRMKMLSTFSGKEIICNRPFRYYSSSIHSTLFNLLCATGFGERSTYFNRLMLPFELF